MDVTGHAFVTGGGSGIGKACCLLFAQLGASSIFVADINLETAQETVTEITAAATSPDFRAEALQLDVSDEDAVKNAVAHMVDSSGRIDYCVHCAGICVRSYQPVAKASFVEFQELLRVHVHGTFLVTSLVSAAMASQEPKQIDASIPQRGSVRGSIVNLASVTSLITPPNIVPYSAAKHAVLGITRTAGKQLPV
ncbi:hypothetical protein SLS62_007402 [Diatrype stigma]|uniref:Uncharacterized protein n=1 Tax=Diatrype stigma TaxID=117547 RepID=A0AAN9UPV4_9PEZI